MTNQEQQRQPLSQHQFAANNHVLQNTMSQTSSQPQEERTPFANMGMDMPTMNTHTCRYQERMHSDPGNISLLNADEHHTDEEEEQDVPRHRREHHHTGPESNININTLITIINRLKLATSTMPMPSLDQALKFKGNK
jgi:hypothetical protein